jgi:lambda repressor-like predicted transcriptional regulator
MTINTIGTSASTAATQALFGRTDRPRQGGGAIAVAAKALGLSTDDVISQLKSGKSLGDIADAQGVSRTDLASALKSGMPDGTASSDKADEIVDRIINQVGLPQRPQGPRPDATSDSTSDSGVSGVSGVLGSSLTSSQQSTLDSLSSLLGTTSDSLLGSLQSGTSLADLVSAAGVSQGSLASILQDGLLIDTTA